MKVTLLNYSNSPDQTVAKAARLCYSADKGTDLINKMESQESVSALVQRLFSVGHLSPFEHVSFTFLIEGISRACSHQLVRHRIASYSQKSQRYVSESKFEFVTPASIKNKEEAVKVYDEAMDEIQSVYNKLISLGVPKEDARFVLPNACETQIIVTMNARALINFFEHRCCVRAQSEIREMANLMLKKVKKVAPNIFEKAGASCETLGYCPEGSMSCGRVPTLADIKNNLI